MYEKIARMTKTPADDEIEAIVTKAQQTFDGMNDRTWLPWAGMRLMPEMTRKAQEEEEEAVCVQKEHRETADRKAREVSGDHLYSIPQLCNTMQHVRQCATTPTACDRKSQVVAPSHQRSVE
jgi:hypothetical protein